MSKTLCSFINSKITGQLVYQPDTNQTHVIKSLYGSDRIYTTKDEVIPTSELEMVDVESLVNYHMQEQTSFTDDGYVRWTIKSYDNRQGIKVTLTNLRGHEYTCNTRTFISKFL